jgi:protein gp37
MHPDWARSLRDQCVSAGLPFFFKQWGEWAPDDFLSQMRFEDWEAFGGTPLKESAFDGAVFRVGKKAAGRLLDGVRWHQFPDIP